jgi:ABC-type nitrate/sulfonate/bicarbonate transport system substrate-binding protein
MRFNRFVVVAAWAAALALAVPRAQAAEPSHPKVTFSLPTVSVNYAFAYVADAKGFWKDEGLDVDLISIAGPSSANALLGGRIEFTGASAVTLFAALARGQKPILFANINDTLTMELVVGKALAEQSGLTRASDIMQRIAVLRGKTIAVDAVNSIIHGYLKYVLRKGGIDPETDVTITPIPAIGVVPALQAKRIDAFVMSAPFTLIPEQTGDGVMWISSPLGDLPELVPTLSTILITRAEFCEKNADSCRRFGAGIKHALAFILDHPEEALALIAPRFKTLDPALLRAAFDRARKSLKRTPTASDEAMAKAQDFAVAAGLLKPQERLASFAGTYTNDYVK